MRPSIEDVILRHSDRGMNILRKYLDSDYCVKAAEKILSWEKGCVFLMTGFYVAGFAETDGPVGTCTIAKALEKLGYSPVVITDKFCTNFFEIENINVEYIDNSFSQNEMEELIEKYSPKGMISIERCGKNKFGEYANMRGISISEFTAPLDNLFEKYEGVIPTIGVGDGGNEIGMGCLKDVITQRLSLEPCIVKADYLVIATVSNWGAYGITCALGIKTGKELLPTFNWIRKYIQNTVDIGSVDGVTHERVVSVDGKGMDIEEEIIEELRKIESEGIKI
ncbi:MAG: DUF4392 domain-containing protein [Lachnospiraceae bacterium]|nr:DUF4392 domain-containing protein [Lachnospiraceae bacterium]MDO4189967.1 DUF4392 domain-containing protein [Lachnospiraceae bacterium]